MMARQPHALESPKQTSYCPSQVGLCRLRAICNKQFVISNPEHLCRFTSGGPAPSLISQYNSRSSRFSKMANKQGKQPQPDGDIPKMTSTDFKCAKPMHEAMLDVVKAMKHGRLNTTKAVLRRPKS